MYHICLITHWLKKTLLLFSVTNAVFIAGFCIKSFYFGGINAQEYNCCMSTACLILKETVKFSE